MPPAPPKRGIRDRQPSSKQAEIDANNANRAAKKAQPKPPARSVQAAARKVSAATSGSITSQTVSQPATLVKKRINPREPNKGTERVTTQQRPPRPPTTATSQAARSVITPTPTKTVPHTLKRIHYTSPPPPLIQDADDLEYIDEDIDHEGLVPDDAEEYPSSEATSVPPSEVDFSDNEHHEDSENDVSEVHVHKRALSTSSDMGLDQPSKVQKTTRGSSDGRARRRDFDYDVRDLIKTTTDLLRIRLYTINAFPSSTELEGWIKETWDEACEREKADVVKEKDIHRLLARCPTQLHSAVKNAARNVVTHEYGFSDSVSKKDKARNRDMHSSITTTTEDSPASWLFPKRERSKPAEDRIDIYQTRAISSFTNKTLYDASSRSRLGVRYADLLGPHLTLAHIAFNLTMIQFAISEWEEGFFQDKTFTEDVGRRLYEAHLVDLESYQEAFGEDMVTRLGEALVQRGRTCAGLEPYSVSGTDKGKIARSVFARMAQRAAADTTTTEAYASDDNESGTGSGDAQE